MVELRKISILDENANECIELMEAQNEDSY